MAGTGLAQRGRRQEQPWHPHRPDPLSRLAGRAALLAPGIALLAADGYDLGRPSLWRDEAYTVDAAHRSLPQIIALLQHTDAVNSAYYLVMHAGIAFLGTSAVALRLPSLLAMAVAAVATSAIGQWLARAARLPAPALTGTVAGLLFTAAPQVTRYAQEARSYGIVTMCAAIATYLLLRALGSGRWHWWAGYGLAVEVAGLFNLFSLLLVIAHGVTLGIGRARQRPALAPPGTAVTVRISRWLAATGAALVVLSPLMALGFGQRKQIGWLVPPGPTAISHLVVSFAGSKLLVPLVALIALAGVAGCLTASPRVPVDAVTFALPWLVLPASILVVASQVHPVFDARYIVFTMPALALMCAIGLSWLARFAALTPLGRSRGALAWLPAALALVMFAAFALGPQRALRRPVSRPDNLRKTSAIVAACERPGDAVLYLPASKRVFSMGYPAPFRRLWDVALARPPVAAANLIGTEVRAATLRARFARVGRVWVISRRNWHLFQHPATRLEKVEIALLRPFHLVRRWLVGQGVISLLRRG